MAIFTQTGRIRKDDGTSSSSPSRRFVRIEEHGASSSSGSEKFKKISSFVGTGEQRKDEELEIQGGELLKRKKRLDARSYRASLKPVAKKTKNSDSGRICRKVTDGEGDRTEVCSSTREDFGTPELVESTSGGRSLADVDMESGSEVRAYKKAKITADLDSDISVTQKASTTDATSSSSGSRNRSIEECSACSKPQRVLNDSEDHALCLCNTETRHNLPISLSKAGGELEVMNSIGIAEGHLNSTHTNESMVTIQTDSGHIACVICKRPGLVLCCHGNGCKRSFHLSCLDPPLKDVPPGVWHCLYCVKKKIESGVYSVSEGIESIWDSKDGMQNEKLYLVKYKGLAHVHDRWIPESLMLLEAPMLLSKFNRKHQKEKVRRWKKEWTEPHRLLLKRFFMPPNHSEQHFCVHDNNFSYCYHEWLVKWKGLDYEHSTWELENSSFLCSPEGLILIKDYERWHEEARKASDPSRADKALSVKNNPLFKLSKLPDGCPPGLNSDYLSSINTLREFWHRTQSAVFIDDQERIVKSILFILSLMSHTCQPFLIITTINSLSSWEAEFVRLAPSINFVVYNGNKNVRKIIQTLEFYEEGGCIMFQVLLSHPEAIAEDLESFDCIGWEAIIVDECQNLRVSTHFEQFRNLSSDFRLLLLNGPLKDDFVEYLNLLSFLDPKGQENPVDSLNFDSDDSADILAVLKERLARYIAYERKSNSSKFLEYWVPVRLSTVQLERYCGILMSNSLSLCSQSKRDNVGALRDILISTRKCCDHPYLVDESLRSSLAKGLPRSKHLDDEVNASGKLGLLDQILQEIKNHGLRVLILFQSTDVPRRISIGDILDDFLCERFGADSYERVDKGMITSKKQASLNMFNDKTTGRFVFLIETRACVPSIKLSSLDAVIIFNSDWNPMNDSRALQRICIDSKVENVLVFRLYSSCTVEEKVLIFAKQHMILESNVQNLSSSVCHSLLSWGASYLFSKLDDFHQLDNTSHFETSTDKLLLNDLSELLTQVPKADVTDTSDRSTLAKAQQSGASYSGNIFLVGEKENFPLLDNEPSTFWSKLLERNSLQLRYIYGSSQRNRRRVELFDEFAKEPNVESDGLRENCTKVASSTADPISPKVWLEDIRVPPAAGKDATLSKDTAPCSSHRPSLSSACQTLVGPNIMTKELGTPVGSQSLPSSAAIMNDVIHNLLMPTMSLGTFEAGRLHMAESEEGENSPNVQKKLHSLLKAELLKLCGALRYPKDVKNLAEMLLEYAMKNHCVSLDSENILQAFIVSLCWRAASFLKQRVDRKESLALAKKYSNFKCNRQEVESVYEKLQILKNKFSHQVGASVNSIESNSVENQPSVRRKYFAEAPMREGSSKRAPFDHRELEEGEIIDDQSSMSIKDVTEDLMNKRCSERASSDHQELEEGEIREIPDTYNCSKLPVLVEQEVAPVLETPCANVQQCIGSLRDEPLNKQADLINEIYLGRLEKLLSKQKLEADEFKGLEDKERIKLKKTRDLDLELIRARQIDPAVRNNEIKLLREEFANKMYEFDQHLKRQRRKLAVMQVNARNKEKQIKNLWLEEAKAGRLAESFDKLPLSDSGFRMEKFKFSGQSRLHDDPENTIIMSGPSSDQQSIDMIATRPGVSAKTAEISIEIPAIVPSIVMEDIPMETETPASDPSSMNAVGSIEPCRHSAESSAIVPLGCESNMPCQTEIPISQSKGTNEVSNELEGMNISSETAAIGDNEQHGAADSDGACLAPLLNQTKLTSSVHASGSSGCEKSASCNQVLPISEQERPSISDGLGCNQDFSSPKHTIVPTVRLVDEGPSQVEPTNHDLAVSDPILLQPPPSLGSATAVNGPKCAPAPVRIEEATNNQMHSSTHQTDVLMQQPSGTIAVQVEQSVSQSVAHPMPSVVNIPSERTGSEYLRITDVRPEAGCNLPQLFTVMQPMPMQGLHPDPLQNELMRLHKQKDLFTYLHEDKKLQLKLECEKEVEKVIKKYDTLIWDADTEFLQKKTTLEAIFNKVRMNQSLAEEFRAKFIEIKGGAPVAYQGASLSSVPQPFQASQPQFAQFQVSASPSTPSPAATAVPQAQTSSPLSSVRLHAPATASATVPLVQAVHSSVVFPSIPVRPHSRSVLQSHANIQAGSGPRAPAPHLRPSRPYTSVPAPNLPPQTGRMVNQWQPVKPVTINGIEPINFSVSSCSTRHS